MYGTIGGSFCLKQVGTISMTDLLLKTDDKFIVSIPLLMKLSLIKCVLATVLRRSLRTGLNNLYWAVFEIIAVTLCSQSRFTVIVCGFLGK